jgi:hypothetical protein
MAFVVISETLTTQGIEMKIMIDGIGDISKLPACAPNSRVFTADRSVVAVRNIGGTWDYVVGGEE